MMTSTDPLARKEAGYRSQATSAVHDQKAAIVALLKHCSVEVTPNGAAKIQDFGRILRPGTKVYVTFLSGSDFNDTIRTVARLRREGMTPVPHIAARSLPSARFLDQSLTRMQREAAVTEALLIAGGVERPLGEFQDSMQVLRTGLLQNHGITTIGVAGHPEGNPDIADNKLIEAVLQKNAYAVEHGLNMYLATQFCFEAAPVIAWDQAMRAAGNRLPIHLGIPGLATIGTLIKHAQHCGIGPSMRVLTRQAANFGKLMSSRTPDVLVRALAGYQASDPVCGIRHCHLFPLGGLHKSAAWLQAVQDGDFDLDGEGFTVSAQRI